MIGDVYWIQLENTAGTEPRIPHPCVVIEVNDSDHSVVICMLTSNIKRVSIAGNVLLEVGEANLNRPSVVEVSKTYTVEKAKLGELIGSLSEQRIGQIRSGIRFVKTSFLDR